MAHPESEVSLAYLARLLAKRAKTRIGKMAQRMTPFATLPDDLSSVFAVLVLGIQSRSSN